jgi:uncharacterized protein (DUF1800 family)
MDYKTHAKMKMMKMKKRRKSIHDFSYSSIEKELMINSVDNHPAFCIFSDPQQLQLTTSSKKTRRKRRNKSTHIKLNFSLYTFSWWLTLFYF